MTARPLRAVYIHTPTDDGLRCPLWSAAIQTRRRPAALGKGGCHGLDCLAAQKNRVAISRRPGVRDVRIDRRGLEHATGFCRRRRFPHGLGLAAFHPLSCRRRWRRTRSGRMCADRRCRIYVGRRAGGGGPVCHASPRPGKPSEAASLVSPIVRSWQAACYTLILPPTPPASFVFRGVFRPGSPTIWNRERGTCRTRKWEVGTGNRTKDSGIPHSAHKGVPRSDIRVPRCRARDTLPESSLEFLNRVLPGVFDQLGPDGRRDVDIEAVRE